MSVRFIRVVGCLLLLQSQRTLTNSGDDLQKLTDVLRLLAVESPIISERKNLGSKDFEKKRLEKEEQERIKEKKRLEEEQERIKEKKRLEKEEQERIKEKKRLEEEEIVEKIQMRDGAPIGFKNPASTCWLNATLTMLFAKSSPLVTFIFALKPQKDSLMEALRDLVIEMHDPNKKLVSFKNDKNKFGPFWIALSKIKNDLNYDRTDDDIEALELILNALKENSSDFGKKFGTMAMGSDFQVINTYDQKKIDLNTTLKELYPQAKLLTFPDSFWAKGNAEPKTPLMFDLTLDLTTWLAKQTVYNLNGATIYHTYKSWDGEKWSAEKIHYGSIVADTKTKKWYLVDDSVVTEIATEDMKEFSKKGTLKTTHEAKFEEKTETYETTWYPSILQYEKQ